MRKNGKLLLCLSLAITLLSFTTAFAVSGYYQVSLPWFKQDVVVMSGSKVYNDDYVLNRVDYVGAQYDAADFWVVRQDGSRISDNYACYEGQGTYTISFKTDERAGTFIMLYAQNHDITYVNVTLSGYADLR